METEGVPEPGDITICIHCGHLMAFADDMTVRPLTDNEMYDIAGDPRLIAFQKARASISAADRDENDEHC